MTTINLYEAKTRLSRLVDAAHEGKTVVIAKSGRPLAKLGPLDPPKRRIRFGLLKGRVRISRGFDDPLPKEIQDAFEGRGR